MMAAVKHFLSVTVVIAVMGILAGCTEDSMLRDVFKPTPFRMGGMPENSPPDYKHGWNDGCESGMATMTSNYYKTFYKFKQDYRMLENKMYYQAWKDSYTYCRQYMFRWVLYKLDNPERFW